MATTDLGESPLMHGRNLKDLLARRIALMERHAKDDPFIDPGYMERMAGPGQLACRMTMGDPRDLARTPAHRARPRRARTGCRSRRTT